MKEQQHEADDSLPLLRIEIGPMIASGYITTDGDVVALLAVERIDIFEELTSTPTTFGKIIYALIDQKDAGKSFVKSSHRVVKQLKNCGLFNVVFY